MNNNFKGNNIDAAKPNSLRSFIENNQSEINMMDNQVYEEEEELEYNEESDEGGSDGMDEDFEHEIEIQEQFNASSSIALPYIPDPSIYGATSQQPRPYLVIANEPLRHFWEQFFPDKQYVRWTTFLNKLEGHLSSSPNLAHDITQTEEQKPSGLSSLVIPTTLEKYPVAPNGYGLHENELNALFREREGKRSLTKALQYALDLEGTGVLSVYQVAIVVQHILPADLPLKHLLFHLAHLGGKILLPATLYPVTSAPEFVSSVHVAFQRAVAAEKDFTTQMLKAQRLQQQAARRRAAPEAEEDEADLPMKAQFEPSLCLPGLYSPYAFASVDLQGPPALQEAVEAFVDRSRGFSAEPNASVQSNIHILAAPSGQGATTRIAAAVRSQLHTALTRRHSLLNLAASKGNLSVWDLLQGPHTAQEKAYHQRVAARQQEPSAMPGARALAGQSVIYPLQEVAQDGFVLGGLFDAVYIDLRGRSTKSDVLAAFSAQLALRGADSNLQAIQDSLQRFLCNLRPGSVLILDHVHSSCTNVVKKLITSSLTLSVEKHRVSVLVIPSMQCATPILSNHGSTADASAARSTNPKAQRLYGSVGRRRAAWEKEQEAKNTAFFLDELRQIVTGLGTAWTKKGGFKDTNESAEDFVLPSNVMLLTYCLTPQETRAATERLYREIKTKESLLAVQASSTNASQSGNAPAHTVPQLESLSTEKLDAICVVSGGIPSLIRLLLWQSLTTLNHLLTRRKEASAPNLPSYMSSANTVKGSKTSTSGRSTTPLKSSNSASNLTALAAPPTAVNPYSGLPSLYSIGWELQQPSAQALTEDDRLLLYALSPLLFAHLQNDSSGGSSKRASSPTPGTRAATPRAYPLCFDGSLAWHLSKAVFMHVVSASGQHNSVQTFTSGRKVDAVQEEAYRRWLLCWNKLLCLGLIQVSTPSLPLPSALPTTSAPYSTVANTVVHFGDAAVPQFLAVKASIYCTLPAEVTNAVSEDALMKTYLNYVATKFSETSQTLSLIEKLLVSPEAGYTSSLLQQKQLLILRSVDAVWVPHFNFLATLIAVQLTPVRAAPADRNTYKLAPLRAKSLNLDTTSEDDGPSRDRAPSMSSENSDPMDFMRRSNSSKLGEGVDQQFSRSLDEEDRNSEFSDPGTSAKDKNRNILDSNRRLRAHSEFSSDDGESGKEGVVPPFERSGSSDTSFSLLSTAEATEMLTSWQGHLRELSLLRLAPDLCTTLAVQCSKILTEAFKSSGEESNVRTLQYIQALYDLGLLLYTQYAEYNHESQLGAGWSRGSLHYSSVESAVSRHLAATSSKLLQEALQLVIKTLPANKTSAKDKIPTPAVLTSKQMLSFLTLQSKLEYALGNLSLTIASEAQRMYCVSRTTTTTVDEILAVKLFNKSKAAQNHGVDLLTVQLPATLAQLRALYTSADASGAISGSSSNEVYRRFLSELENYSLGRFGTSPRPVHSPTKGIGIGSMDYVDVSSTPAGTSNVVLPDSLRTLVDRVYVERLEADASVLVAEYFSNQAVNRKIGDVNAMFVQCMVPGSSNTTTTTTTTDTSTKPSVVVKSNIRKVGGPTAAPSATSSDLPRPPLPRGISSGDLHTNTIPTTSAAPSSETAVSDPAKPASVSVDSHNNMYPLLLHTGTQDLRYMLLDGEYLVHQASFVEKLTEELETAATSTVTVSAAANPSAESKATSLVFNQHLTAEEEAVINNTTPVVTLQETRFSNAHLVHSYRTSLLHYRNAITLYNTLYGANSITTAKVSILLANLYRIFGHDEIAKPLYETSLKVFKNHALATYQLPTVMAAHCWLGLASYFDEHQPGLPSLYEQLKSAKKNNQDGSYGKASQKGKNDLALRLYEESLSIYKSIYGNTHYTVTLTSQALVGVLCGLGRFERGNVLLKESIAVTRLTLQRDRIMQRYLRRQLRLTKRKAANSVSHTTKTTTTGNNNTPTSGAIVKLELAVESNEFALQSSMSYLAKLLVILGRFYDLHKQHHLAVAVYKEAIICMRELRVSFVRRYRELEQLKEKTMVVADNADPYLEEEQEQEEEEEEEEEDHHLLANLGINQPERELSLHIAQTMRDLAQSLFAEGVKLMGNKKIQNLSLPDFQYRHALYVINRAIEIYQGFDLSISAPLLKETFTQRAAMHAAQSDFQEAKHCYEQIMRLFMEVKFPNYQDIAVVRTEYARLLVSCNEAGEAALLYEQSIDVYRRKLGDNWVCIEVAENLLERGAALLDLKAYEEAQPCLEDALKMLPMVLNKHKSRPATTANGVSAGPIGGGRDNAMYDVRMAACYSHLAAVFHYYEEYGQAMTHYQSAQQVYTNAGKAFSLEMANVCNNLATLYDDLGQLTEAKAMYEQTVVILFRFHGAAHPQILVTLENLMNLLQDMKLNEEYQSVLDHLDSMEKQITTQLAEDTDRLEALNRALYGQALADQERTALLQINNSSRSGSQKLLSAASVDSISNDNIDGGKGGGNVAGTARHPFAPQQIMIVGGVDEGSDEDEADTQFAADTYHHNNNHHFQPDHYSDNVLLSMQAQEQALSEDQADSFFSFTNIGTRLASTVGSVGQNLSGLNALSPGKKSVNAEEEWGRINKGLDGAMDEEDGFKYGNAAHSPRNADALNLNYLGDFNNNSELQAMRRDLNAKLNAPSSPNKASQSTGGGIRGANHSAAVNKGRASIADTYKRGGSTGSKMRSLRPLNEVRQEKEEELPAGNCSMM